MGRIIYDDYNGNVPQCQTIIGGVTTMWGRDSMRHGWKVIEIEEMDDETTHISCAMRTRRYANKPQAVEPGCTTANALTRVSKDSLVLEGRTERTDEGTQTGGG